MDNTKILELIKRVEQEYKDECKKLNTNLIKRYRAVTKLKEAHFLPDDDITDPVLYLNEYAAVYLNELKAFDTCPNALEPWIDFKLATFNIDASLMKIERLKAQIRKLYDFVELMKPDSESRIINKEKILELQNMFMEMAIKEI